MTILEIQVADTQEDLTELEGDVNFLFDEQIIQDERLFTLEQTTDAINVELDLIDDEFDTIGSELESELWIIILLHINISYYLCLYSSLFIYYRCPNFNLYLGFSSNDFGGERRG